VFFILNVDEFVFALDQSSESEKLNDQDGKETCQSDDSGSLETGRSASKLPDLPLQLLHPRFPGDLFRRIWLLVVERDFDRFVIEGLVDSLSQSIDDWDGDFPRCQGTAIPR